MREKECPGCRQQVLEVFVRYPGDEGFQGRVAVVDPHPESQPTSHEAVPGMSISVTATYGLHRCSGWALRQKTTD